MPRLRSGSSSSRDGPAEGEGPAGGLDLQPVNLPPSHHHSSSYRSSPLGGTLSQLQRALESLQSGAENLQHELSSTLPFFSWGSSGSGNGGGSLHSFKRDLSNSGLVVGSGPAAQERMRALLGLAVVNLCALGGSASALLSPQVCVCMCVGLRPGVSRACKRALTLQALRKPPRSRCERTTLACTAS